MINFFDELNEKYELNISKSDGQFKVIFIPSGCYVEGHCGVISFSENEIAFKLKRGAITFVGENLFIKNLEVDVAIISGKVLKIERI